MHTVTRIGRSIHADHHHALAVLDGLDALIERHADDDPPDAAALREVLDDVDGMLAEDVERHFAFEEHALFPLLVREGSHELAALLGLQHEELRPLCRHLGRIGGQLRAVPPDPELWPVFRALGRDLVSLLVEHIQVEEVALLAAIDRLVDAELDDSLARLFAAASMRPPPGRPVPVHL